MQLVDSYTVVVSDAIEACRDFYATWFDFEVTFEASWFVLLTRSRRTPTVPRVHAPGPSVISTVARGVSR